MKINRIAPSSINKTKMYYHNLKKNINKIKNENFNKHILSSDGLAKIIKCMIRCHLVRTSRSVINVNEGVY